MIQERILQYIEFKGISAYKFCKDLGFSLGYLDKRGSIGTDKYLKIIEYYDDLSPNWLLKGEGSMIKNISQDLIVSEPQEVYRKTQDTRITSQIIPLYSIQASAGVVKLFQDQNANTPIDYLSIPNLNRCDGALFVSGDSMYPLLKSGDIIVYRILNEISHNIIWGEMYLIVINIDGDDYASVKFIHKSEHNPEHIRLVSHNKHHQDKEVHLSTVLTMAHIKASVRYNVMVG